MEPLTHQEFMALLRFQTDNLRALIQDAQESGVEVPELSKALVEMVNCKKRRCDDSWLTMSTQSGGGRTLRAFV